MPRYFFGIDPLPDVENGHVFENKSFLQAAPHTAIFTGKTGLIFRRCNLTNCDIPPDTVMEQCLRAHMNFCSHVHPEWLRYGYISDCVEQCSHVVDSDQVTIDGVVVDTVYHYADTEVD